MKFVKFYKNTYKNPKRIKKIITNVNIINTLILKQRELAEEL